MVIQRALSRIRRTEPTLHVLTVHHREPRLVPIQVRFLRQHIGMPYRVWAVVDGIPEESRAGLDIVVEHEGDHPERLNHLARLVLDSAPDHDRILFLDSDAWPVAPIAELARSVRTITAVRRDENVGDPQPHPCFALTSVGFWRELGGDWRRGRPWVNAAGWSVRDVGGRVLQRLEKRGIAWDPLLRVNGTQHGVWFALYGDAVRGPIAYHHGAGSRGRFSRHDIQQALGDPALGGLALDAEGQPADQPGSVVRGTMARLREDETRATEQAEWSERALRLIEAGDRFWMSPDWDVPLLAR